MRMPSQQRANRPFGSGDVGKGEVCSGRFVADDDRLEQRQVLAPSCWAPGPRISAPPRSVRPIRRWHSPHSPAAAADACSIPGGSPPCTTGMSSAAPSSRTSDSGSDHGTTHMAAEPPRKVWGRRCCANVPPCVAESAFSMVPLSARSTCRGRTQANSRHALHQHDEHPQGRRRRPVPGVHHHRRCRPHPRPDGGMAADTKHFRSWRGATPLSTACTSESAGSASPASSPKRSTSWGGTQRRCGRS